MYSDFIFNFEIRRCGMIANETTLHQSSNEGDVSGDYIYRQLYSLQQLEKPIQYGQL